MQSYIWQRLHKYSVCRVGSRELIASTFSLCVCACELQGHLFVYLIAVIGTMFTNITKCSLTCDINGATIAPTRHSDPLVPIPRARIVVG